MKINFTSEKMDVSLTTNSGKPIYSYDAENVSVSLDIQALIEGAAVIGSMIEQVVNNGGDLSTLDALIASMQQAESEKTDAA